MLQFTLGDKTELVSLSGDPCSSYTTSTFDVQFSHEVTFYEADNLCSNLGGVIPYPIDGGEAAMFGTQTTDGSFEKNGCNLKSGFQWMAAVRDPESGKWVFPSNG